MTHPDGRDSNNRFRNPSNRILVSPRFQQISQQCYPSSQHFNLTIQVSQLRSIGHKHCRFNVQKIQEFGQLSHKPTHSHPNPLQETTHDVYKHQIQQMLANQLPKRHQTSKDAQLTDLPQELPILSTFREHHLVQEDEGVQLQGSPSSLTSFPATLWCCRSEAPSARFSGLDTTTEASPWNFPGSTFS